MTILNDLITKTDENTVNCNPILVSRVKRVITDLYEKEGLHFAAFMGYRSPEHQYALWMQSRYPLEEINSYRFKHNLPCITQADALLKVTSIPFSWHCVGLAIDLVENADPKSNTIKWSWSNIMHYKKIGKYCGLYGLDWGGLWNSLKDYPHLEYTKGRKLEEAHKVYTSKGLKGVWEWM
jgi:hypothetical protein